MNTQPFVVQKPTVPDPDESRHGQLVDLQEVRRRLAEMKEPTPKDFLEALNAERAQVDRLTAQVQNIEQCQLVDSKHFGANVAEVVEPLVAKAAKKPLLMVVSVQVVLAAVLLATCVSMYFSFRSVNSSVNAVSDYAATKASWQAVGVFEDELATKATKTELKVVQTKADQSVVERLAQELRDNDGNHDNRLNDLATDLMAKANRQDVEKLSARLRATRSKVRSLEQRMKELAPTPDSAPSADLPKTM